VNSILEGLGYAPLTRKVRLPLAYGAGTICEFVWNVLKRRDDPPMTRFVAVELAKDHYFDISAAKSDLGYVAKVPMEEALRQTVNDLKKRGY
jgi:nucleoside-diphosphate-sugar epimerase